MKFIVFYLEFINSLEGPGMFFSSAAIIRRLRKYTATVITYDPKVYLTHVFWFLMSSVRLRYFVRKIISQIFSTQ